MHRTFMRWVGILLVSLASACVPSKCPSGDKCGVNVDLDGSWNPGWDWDGGPWTGACPGTDWVDAGMLAGGSPGTAVATSTFGPQGARVILATNAEVACAAETEIGLPHTGSQEVAVVRLTLAEGIGPGTYALGGDAGQVAADYGFGFACGELWVAGGAMGEVSLTNVEPSSGVSGTYWLDFGRSGFGGGGGSSGGGGVVSCGPLGELYESGSFNAPPCEACAVPQGCGGDAGCPWGQVCARGCGGTAGQCIPAPSCTEAPSCGNCSADLAKTCGQGFPGGGCGFYDGFSLICSCAP